MLCPFWKKAEAMKLKKVSLWILVGKIREEFI